MASVFDKIGDIRNDVRRNNFDWSHTNNFTTAFGRITPVFCEYCPPNSSLNIDPEFGLRFMPMMFPVQTNMKAYLSFYRVPVRTLWKDYKDFVSSPNGDSTLEAPYICALDAAYGDGNMLGLSGLADYLGIPVTSIQGTIVFDKTDQLDPQWRVSSSIVSDLPSSGFWSTKPIDGGEVGDPKSIADTSSAEAYYRFMDFGTVTSVQSDTTELEIPVDIQITMGNAYWDSFLYLSNVPRNVGFTRVWERFGTIFVASVKEIISGQYQIRDIKLINSESIKVNRGYVTPIGHITTDLKVQANDHIIFGVAHCTEFFNANSDGTSFGEKDIFIDQPYMQVSITKENTPYYTKSHADKEKQIKLSAYPFRAYEAIYNAYIRNIKNNPFKINGKEKYNTWIPTDDGGADENMYSLHYANWASDMFTTAVPSPQQGQAPLVGITTYSKQVVLENGHVETQLGTAIVDEDGKKYDVTFQSNGDSLKGVTYRELDPTVPVSKVQNLYDLVTSGISINDFRNVNAYQRYLELNMFRGYSYKQIIEGRYDVNIKYDDLNMPEYIGGCTRDISMNPVTQTVETSSDGSYLGALGSQSGNATLYGRPDANISCFCDEESYVIGILTVVPMPVYTQVLPKHFLYRDRLDVPTPEFDHIGFQPIPMKEISPILQWQTNKDKMNDTFGYQRPWYEFCQKIDTAAGLFRTQLRNFLINRVFQAPPALNPQFTTVDPDEVNDVFSVTETTDKILGQIVFHTTAKLPISRVVVPKLE